MVLILPPLAVEGQVKMERKALRAKSPDPPMPFIMLRPRTWVLLTLPVMSTSMAVLMERMPRRRMTSGLLVISCGRSRSLERKKSRFCVDVPQNRIAHRQRATAGEADFAALDQRNDGVLNHLGVHVEPGDFGMRAHGIEHGVGGVADAGLDGQKARRDQPALQFGGEKIGHVFADARGRVGDGAERAAFIGLIGFDNAGDFLRVHFDHGRADAVGRGEEWEWAGDEAGVRVRRCRGSRAGLRDGNDSAQ